MILGTAGHIDHGKTALVKALTGVDADRLPEEKRRGITIDLGFAPLEIEGTGTIGIVDVPGHEGFIRTMLAGATGIDMAMLVVAADEGVMPQTREHLDILSLLRIPRGLVALTKSDLADPEWRSLVADDVRALCAGTPLEDAEIIEVSATTGARIGDLKAAIARLAKESSVRPRDVFRLPVDRAFTVRGTGTVVTGTAWTGSVKRDDLVTVQPGGKVARVRAIQSHGQSIEESLTGARTAIALSGCDVDDVPRGSTLVTHAEWVPTREMDVSLTILDESFRPTPRTRVRLHIGTSDTEARLSRLRTGDDGALYSRLVLDDPVMARGTDRFVIRLPSPARTVGGGEVIDPYPIRRGKSRRALSPAGEGDSLDDRFRAFLTNAGPSGVRTASLPIRVGYTADQASTACERTGAIIAGDFAVSSVAVEALERFMESFVAIHTANHPLEPGVSLQTLRAATKAPPPVIDLVLDRLIRGRRIELAGSFANPAGRSVVLDAREQAISDAILHDICNQPAEPPSVRELESKFGRTTMALLRRLERQGDIQRVSEDRYYSKEAVAGMVRSLRTGLAPGRSYSPAELKDVLGVTRKYLIPFLEFCDRTGVTERGGDGRKVRPGAA